MSMRQMILPGVVCFLVGVLIAHFVPAKAEVLPLQPSTSSYYVGQAGAAAWQHKELIEAMNRQTEAIRTLGVLCGAKQAYVEEVKPR